VEDCRGLIAIVSIIRGLEGGVKVLSEVNMGLAALLLAFVNLAGPTFGVVLVIVFFITSSDSGSLVIDTIAAGGKTNAPVIQRVFWASFEGAVAVALLLGGGLAALQAMAVSTGLPFTLVLLAACYAVVRGLMNEARG